MSTKPRGIGARAVLAVSASSLVLGAALLWGANRLYMDRRPQTPTPDLLLNEGLLLLSLLILQSLLLSVLAGRLIKPLRDLGRLLAGESSLPVGSGNVPKGLGEVTYVYENALRLLEGQQGGGRAQEDLDRVRADAERIQGALKTLDQDPRPKFTPQTEPMLALGGELERHLAEIQDLREENAAVAVQVETEGRETVLAAREASTLAEATYLEVSELGVALRDLNRLIQGIRPVLESEALPARGAEDPGGNLSRACKILTDIADRHRLFALRISREWGEGSGGAEASGLLEGLKSHLEEVEGRSQEAAVLLAGPGSEAGGEMAGRAREALKKLLQSAEITQERLSRLVSAAERTSSSARRVTGLAERELQGLEALGVRLERESGPMEPAETLGESDFVSNSEA